MDAGTGAEHYMELAREALAPMPMPSTIWRATSPATAPTPRTSSRRPIHGRSAPRSGSSWNEPQGLAVPDPAQRVHQPVPARSAQPHRRRARLVEPDIAAGETWLRDDIELDRLRKVARTSSVPSWDSRTTRARSSSSTWRTYRGRSGCGHRLSGRHCEVAARARSRRPAPRPPGLREVEHGPARRGLDRALTEALTASRGTRHLGPPPPPRRSTAQGTGSAAAPAPPLGARGRSGARRAVALLLVFSSVKEREQRGGGPCGADHRGGQRSHPPRRSLRARHRGIESPHRPAVVHRASGLRAGGPLCGECRPRTAGRRCRALPRSKRRGLRLSGAACIRSRSSFCGPRAEDGRTMSPPLPAAAASASCCGEPASLAMRSCRISPPRAARARRPVPRCTRHLGLMRDSRRVVTPCQAAHLLLEEVVEPAADVAGRRVRRRSRSTVTRRKRGAVGPRVLVGPRSGWARVPRSRCSGRSAQVPRLHLDGGRQVGHCSSEAVAKSAGRSRRSHIERGAPGEHSATRRGDGRGGSRFPTGQAG